eukprot:scaffold11310_cov107-Isochrysis_galbana.AAC.1
MRVHYLRGHCHVLIHLSEPASSVVEGSARGEGERSVIRFLSRSTRETSTNPATGAARRSSHLGRMAGRGVAAFGGARPAQLGDRMGWPRGPSGARRHPEIGTGNRH